MTSAARIAAASLLTLLAARTAAAETLAQVCQTLVGTQVTKCMAAGRGRYFDQNAGAVCVKLVGTQVIECVAASIGKVYAPDEAATCGGLVGTQVIECMGQTGHEYVPAPPPPPPGPGPRHRDEPGPRGRLTIAEIRGEIAAALEQMRANDIPGADARLRRLLRDLR